MASRFFALLRVERVVVARSLASVLFVRFFAGGADVCAALCAALRCAECEEAASDMCPEDSSAIATEAEMRAFRRILNFRGAERQSTF